MLQREKLGKDDDAVGKDQAEHEKLRDEVGITSNGSRDTRCSFLAHSLYAATGARTKKRKEKHGDGHQSNQTSDGASRSMTARRVAQPQRQ